VDAISLSLALDCGDARGVAELAVTGATDGLTVADNPEPLELVGPAAVPDVQPATNTAVAATHTTMRHSEGRGLFMREEVPTKAEVGCGWVTVEWRDADPSPRSAEYLRRSQLLGFLPHLSQSSIVALQSYYGRRCSRGDIEVPRVSSAWNVFQELNILNTPFALEVSDESGLQAVPSDANRSLIVRCDFD